MGDGRDLQDRIARHYSGLRRSEQRVADYLNQIAGQRLNHSITDFSRLIGVSEATVSRLSKALGFSGYPDMKLSIAAASHPNADYPNIPAELRRDDSIADISRKLSSVLSASLAETEKLLDKARLEQAVQLILAASKVVFIGVGGAAAICEEAAHIFLKIGIEASSHNDGYTQTVIAATLKPDALLFAISHTGTTPTVVSAVRAARRNGVKTIGLTGSGDSALAEAAELVFTTTQGAARSLPLHGDFLEGRICQLFLIDVLYVGVMFRLDAVAKDHLAMTTKALADHFGTALPVPQPAKGKAQRRPKPGGSPKPIRPPP